MNERNQMTQKLFLALGLFSVVACKKDPSDGPKLGVHTEKNFIVLPMSDGTRLFVKVADMTHCAKGSASTDECTPITLPQVTDLLVNGGGGHPCNCAKTCADACTPPPRHPVWIDGSGSDGSAGSATGSDSGK